jgi:outer membrane protein assembly factor BamB
MSMVALLFCAVPSFAADNNDWPTFRGADRTGVSKETGLLTQWPDNGPELVWEAKGAGKGYAGVAIAGGRLYTLGNGLSTASDDDEYLVCFDQKTGKQLWTSRTGPPWKAGPASWQSSRSTPTVDGDMVYVITPHGKLVCVTADGKEKFRVDLKEKFGGRKAEIWGYSESVLIDGDRLICTPGGSKNTMVALDKKTGEKVWSSSREGDRGAGHASIVISEVGSVRVYVQTTGSGAMGVRASDGKLMWTYDIDKTTAVIPTPIVRGDLVFFSAGYNRGGALLRQVANGDSVTMKEVYPLKRPLNNKHGGIVLVGDYLYGDSNDKGTPFCADLMTGEVKWKSRGSGKGSASIAAADGYLYIRYTNGQMTLVKADPTEMKESGSFKVPGSGQLPSWAHPVIAGGRLYLREGDSVLCYNISSGAAGSKSAKMDGEMLPNGGFANGSEGWVLSQVEDAAAKMAVVNEGPKGIPAAKVDVEVGGDESWHVQLHSTDLPIVQDKQYVLKFWAKARSYSTITVNCMQNHEPWEHSTSKNFDVSTEWEQFEFAFTGPWDDEKGRVTFTNLGNYDGQVFWFAGCSLTSK